MTSAPLNGAAAVFLIFATLYAAQALALRAFGARDRAARWAGAVAIGLCTAIASFHLLATFLRFRVGEALVLALIGALLVRAVTSISLRAVAQLLGEDLHALVRFVLGDNPSLRPLRAALVAAASLVFTRALILPPLGHDSVTYHAVKAAMWVQTGGALSLHLPGAWNVYRYYPPAGEILGAWAMLPFHDDTFYLLVDTMLWAALLPTVVGLCAELGIEPRFRAPICIYILTCAAIYYFVPSGYVDITHNLLLLCACLFTLRVIRGATPAASACLALACALAAAAVKITALGVPAIELLVIGLALRTAPDSRQPVLRGLVAGAALGMAVLAPTLIRNVIEQGYPLSPFGVKLLGVTLGRVAPELAWYVSPSSFVTSPSNEVFQLASVLGLKQPLAATFGAAAPLLLVLAPIGLWKLYRVRPLAAVLIALLVGYQCSAYLLPNFAVVRARYGFCNARFFYLAPTFAALLAPMVFRRFRLPILETYLVAAAAVSIGIYLLQFPSFVERTPLLVSGASTLAGLLLANHLLQSAKSGIAGATALGCVAAALLLGTGPLQAFRLNNRYPALALSIIGHHIPTEWAELAPDVDDPAHPHRIAINSGPFYIGSRQLMYYYMGSKLQNELVYVSVLPNDEIPIYDRDKPLVPPLDADAWVRRVRASGASHVLVLAPPWHELTWMTRRPDQFELIRSNGPAWLFRVR